LGVAGSGVYVLDPPLGSIVSGSRGSRKSSASPGAGNAYYEGGSDGSEWHQATPSERKGGWVNLVLVDGHAEALRADYLDGVTLRPDRRPNNAWFNGHADPEAR
jgi:prepilin-type processing-associated H-X9-DG protein